ncbi:MAG: hypothetical protein JST04_00670 [Bdellovibrionales bacterium]|nr:hypothetical protein [Bdellovibrionales bacterium]
MQEALKRALAALPIFHDGFLAGMKQAETDIAARKAAKEDAEKKAAAAAQRKVNGGAGGPLVQRAPWRHIALGAPKAVASTAIASATAMTVTTAAPPLKPPKQTFVPLKPLQAPPTNIATKPGLGLKLHNNSCFAASVLQVCRIRFCCADPLTLLYHSQSLFHIPHFVSWLSQAANDDGFASTLLQLCESTDSAAHDEMWENFCDSILKTLMPEEYVVGQQWDAAEFLAGVLEKLGTPPVTVSGFLRFATMHLVNVPFRRADGHREDGDNLCDLWCRIAPDNKHASHSRQCPEDEH